MQILSRGLMEGRRLPGREGIRRWFREVDEQFDEWRIATEEWRDAGDYVVALGRLHMHGRESGITFDQPVGWLFEIRDGQVLRLETFLDQPAEALEAAGAAGVGHRSYSDLARMRRNGSLGYRRRPA